jgi:acetyl-CoA carboxylase carboxyltransferase component
MDPESSRRLAQAQPARLCRGGRAALVTVITRKAYWRGRIVMGSKQLGADLGRLAPLWGCAVMGGQGAVVRPFLSQRDQRLAEAAGRRMSRRCARNA